MKDIFISAIHSKNKVRITFFSKEDGRNLIRKCAPMDFGPSRRATNRADRFHAWDYESDEKNHTLSLLPEQIVSIEVLSEMFNPSEFIRWEPNWIVTRDWGDYS
jgi:hypothetical protein